MIFKYLTIEKSVEVELDIDTINSHKLTIIRNDNINPDGSLIHPEPILLDDVELIPETQQEQDAYNKILDAVGTVNYYYDEVRDKYLGQTAKDIAFYIDGTGRKNQYMYQIPGIVSSSIPATLFVNSCLVGLEWYTSNTLNLTNTIIMTIYDNDTNNIIYEVVVDGTASSGYIDTLNIDVPANTKISAYVDNERLDNPVVKPIFRQVFTK